MQTPRFVLSLMVLVSALVCGAGSARAQTTCVVDNTSDADAALPPIPNSLSDCLRRVGPGDTIVFDPVVFDLRNADAATVIHVVGPFPRSTTAMSRSKRPIAG